MSCIKAIDTLSGTITAECTLIGRLSPIGEIIAGVLSCPGSLDCKLSSLIVVDYGVSDVDHEVDDYDVYDGDYTVVPLATKSQTLETAHRLMKDDVVVTEVPYSETGNTSGGLTVYIAKEV